MSRRALIRYAVGSAAGAAGSAILVERALRTANQSPQEVASTSQDSKSSPTFFVSQSGNDNADGLTEESAWRTIQKLNSALPRDGSIVRFNRGDTFYGELDLPLGCDVGAYGTGEKPVLTLFKLLNKPEGWVEDRPGVWKIDLSNPLTHGGYTASNDANIGFLMIDGVVKAALKFDMAELVQQWDFLCDIPKHCLYVAANDNPTALAANIKAAPNGNAYGASGTVIYCQLGQNDVHDIHITGSGGCGIRGASADVHVHECLIDYIGGSLLLGYGDGITRYGNGIEHFRQAHRWVIEQNEIAHVYDVAWSPQGYDLGDSRVVWEDMTVRNNHLHDCGQMFEFWSQSDGKAAGFVRVRVHDNVCERAGYGPFSDVTPRQQARVHLLTYAFQTPVDIVIENNTFDDAYGAYVYHDVEPPPGFITRNNVIKMGAGHKVEYQRPETVEQFVEWQKETGREVGSTMTIVT